MDALIQLGRLDEANHLLANAEKHKIDQRLLDQLKSYISKHSLSKLSGSSSHNMETSQLNILIQLYNEKRYEELLRKASDVQKQFPTSIGLI